MADTNVASATPTVSKPTAPAPANGTAPAKRETKPREVPMIGISATKEEYAELQAGLAALMTKGGFGDLKINVPLAPFVLALALKQLRGATK